MTADSLLTRLQEERDQALADLRDLDAQVSAGEIPEDRAADLRERYRAAAARALTAIDHHEVDGGRPGRSLRRMAIGASAFLLAAAAITVTLVAAVEPRPEGGFVTGGVAADVASGGAVDLSSVTNEQMEQVVAANPDTLPMRLALARRYLEQGDFSSALDHYLYVLERETNPEALMYVGWMTYLSGESATAAALLEESLEVLPGEPLAQWFLANIRFHGLDDPAGAVPLLEAVVAHPEVPADVVAEARRLLAAAAP